MDKQNDLLMQMLLNRQSKITEKLDKVQESPNLKIRAPSGILEQTDFTPYSFLNATSDNKTANNLEDTSILTSNLGSVAADTSLFTISGKK